MSSIVPGRFLGSVLAVLFLSQGVLQIFGQIQPAADAPQPMSSEESARQVEVPPGFQLELVASEPLIQEPSGVCWDEQGRLYVSELHGYNLEGHLDVQELNQTGELDHKVRRIKAHPEAQKEALEDTYGTVKRLEDTDGDGRMDRALVFADRLPPVYGICPARGGIIAACAPHIIYLADPNGDGHAEVREILFTGFKTGALERGINDPQWGLDNWIYIGSGHDGGRITGPNIDEPVRLGSADFRIQPDGKAIEPVTGSTHTMGHAFTAGGDRFTSTTSTPGLFVTPIPWRYQVRNPNARSPHTQENAADYQRVYPIAPPHPWRVKRAEDPGFFKFYRERYGRSDSDPGGWFTSVCSPLIYRDTAWSEEYRGDYFVCEPAQNLIHRALIRRDGATLRLERHPDHAESEFLASGDQWFHPIALSHGPDGAVYIVDFYREIIEDYSAIPRYLQQQYNLVAGQKYGRIWRLTHESAPAVPDADMAKLNAEQLAGEIGSPHYWRRQTARRLFVERDETGAASALSRLVQDNSPVSTVLNALYALAGLNELAPRDVLAALAHPDPKVRRHGLRLAEPWLDQDEETYETVLDLSDDSAAIVRLQLALTLGESQRFEALSALGRLVLEHGGERWMSEAVLSSIHGRESQLLEYLLGHLPAGNQPPYINPFLEELSRTTGAGRDPGQAAVALKLSAGLENADHKYRILKGLASGLGSGTSIVWPETARQSLSKLVESASQEVRAQAIELMRLASAEQQQVFVKEAMKTAVNLSASPERRRLAVKVLAASDSAEATEALLESWRVNTPALRATILESLFARRDRLPRIMTALENDRLDPRTLTAYQRLQLLEYEDRSVRKRAAALIETTGDIDEILYQKFAAALDGKHDVENGKQLFQTHCATCHTAHGFGQDVGPDLTAEFQRSEEAILLDVLAPNAQITAGYETYQVEMRKGVTLSGVLASESATSINLRLPGGVEEVVLKKDIQGMIPQPVSLMPEALRETLVPADLARIIGWLRSAGRQPSNGSNPAVLFDEQSDFPEQLKAGGGEVRLVHADAVSGEVSLEVTPLQRHSASIQDWAFPIRRNPGPGEYRFLRFSWKTTDGEGVLIELAADGEWPEPDSPVRRYYAGKNTSEWAATKISGKPPREWQTVTVDLGRDCGEFTLTGIAPTALGGAARFDRFELWRDLSVGDVHRRRDSFR